MSEDLFKISITAAAIRNLQKIDKYVATQIRKRIKEYLVLDPAELGKPLTHEYKGLYRYRYGDYRILYKIIEDEKTIVISRIAHRSELY